MTSEEIKTTARKASTSFLDAVVETLCDEQSHRLVSHKPMHDQPMPSITALTEIMQRLQAAIFPGYFDPSEVRREVLRYHIGANLETIYRMLCEQILRGHCFYCAEGNDPSEEAATCSLCQNNAQEQAKAFLESLPKLRHLLATDVKAAFIGDPAAKSPGEAIFCYPSIVALTHQRIAHELLSLGVDLLPRIITEMAHSKTGIDIHPGATIGEGFFIDHGTGVVIGETCIIGDNVRLYQGVTLGAKSFPKDEDGKLIKNIDRHPIVEDNAIIYSGATILGRVTIGKGSVIGGNVWLTQSVPAGSTILQQRSEENAVSGL
ncbi:MAG: serine O-acetyltransferase EpsC [Desulfovibrio sp.]